MKRISTEARLLDWIDEAPIEVVTSIMNIATSRVKARVKAAQPASSPRVTKRKVVVKKVNSGMGQQTAFPGDAVTGATA